MCIRDRFVSILAGVTTAMRAGESGGAMRGACVGLLYMALGIVCYALMMGQSPRLTAYLADLGMGLAAGGLFGMILTARKTGLSLIHILHLLDDLAPLCLHVRLYGTGVHTAALCRGAFRRAAARAD